MSEDGDAFGDDDPFAGLTLDEQFVAEAGITEESAAARLERMHRIDAEHAQLSRQREAERQSSHRHDRRARRRQVTVLVAFLGVLAGLFVWNVARDARGSEQATSDVPQFGGDGATRSAAGEARPPGGVGSTGSALGEPAPLAGTSGSYAFIVTQPGSDAPVAYDPCRAVHVVVNVRTAPPGAEEWLSDALAATSMATGLQFVRDGVTEEAPSDTRNAYLPDRYPGTWAPVLIAWSDPEESPELEGPVAGRGGSSWLETDDGSVYVSGAIELDGPQFARIAAGLHGDEDARGVIEHELGHVVGLDHVDDPTQLMNPSDDGSVSTFAAGDLTGLARLGTGRCFPDV